MDSGCSVASAIATECAHKVPNCLDCRQLQKFSISISDSKISPALYSIEPVCTNPIAFGAFQVADRTAPD